MSPASSGCALPQRDFAGLWTPTSAKCAFSVKLTHPVNFRVAGNPTEALLSRAALRNRTASHNIACKRQHTLGSSSLVGMRLT